MHNLRVRLLGDLQVEGCDPSALGRRQVRTLLKVLALHRDRPVGLDRLVDCLWGDDPPARPADQVSVLVSRLRGVLGADRVRRNDAGYTVTLDWAGSRCTPGVRRTGRSPPCRRGGGSRPYSRRGRARTGPGTAGRRRAQRLVG